MESLEKLGLDVLDNLQEGCQVIGFDWKYLYVNDALVRQGQLPREQLMGRTMMECYPGLEKEPFFPVLRRSMEERTRERLEINYVFPNGTSGWFDLRVLPVPDGICIISLDTTETKRASQKLFAIEEQLRQAQKMEAVGLLAGGVAHDFNNILSVVLGYSDIVLAGLDATHPTKHELSEIRRAALRAADLTRRLLVFSRQQVLDPKVLLLNDVLLGMAAMLKRILGADVELVTAPAPELGCVRIDRSSIEQVVMNLAVNARDAMPHGGRLAMRTANVALDGEAAKGSLGIAPGQYVLLEVTDSGIGMDEALHARIFEPFFTTKEKGRGTGLGLSMVHGIVQQSGGGICFDSAPGKGTTFRIYLPRVDAMPDTAPVPEPAPAPRGHETILLVEDDEQVRRLASAILRRSGYRVLEARSAAEAILHAERYRDAIHLLLSDVVIPQMSGAELADRLLSLHPEMKVLWMSGYTEEGMVRRGVLPAKGTHLEKPLTVELLTAKVREVLA